MDKKTVFLDFSVICFVFLWVNFPTTRSQGQEGP